MKKDDNYFYFGKFKIGKEVRYWGGVTIL